MKFKFKKAIIHCDENEPIYKIKIFIKKNKKSLKFNVKIPEIDLSEPLSNLVNYIYKSLKNNNNIIFENNFNLRVTRILKKLA